MLGSDQRRFSSQMVLHRLRITDRACRVNALRSDLRKFGMQTNGFLQCASSHSDQKLIDQRILAFHVAPAIMTSFAGQSVLNIGMTPLGFEDCPSGVR